MTDQHLNDADRRAIALATLDLPLDDDALRNLGDLGPIGQAALLLAMDESALEAWYLAAPDPAGAISRILMRAVDHDDVADRIDAELESDPTVLADLCRAQITWSHPAMAALLDRDEMRTGASWMLAQTDFEPLLEWLEGEREPEELVDVARGAASSGVVELFEPFAAWHEALVDESPQLAAQLEGALFVLSPSDWGRGFVTGDFSADFLSDEVAMADIISAAGQSYWTAALASFDADSDEFHAIARMTAAGAAANLHFAADEPPREIVDAFYVENWAAMAKHPAFTIAGVLAEEEDWQRPLLEAAAHDVLLTHGLDSPGIGGLPLSSSQPDADEVNAAKSMADLPEIDPVALVATICDVQELGKVRGYTELPEEFSKLSSHAHPAVAGAARRLGTPTSLDADARLAQSESVRGLAAADRVAQRSSIDALHALLDAFATGPILRASSYAALLLQELRASNLRQVTGGDET